MLGEDVDLTDYIVNPFVGCRIISLPNFSSVILERTDKI